MTLIELLVVIGIIAILASVAIVNLQYASIRSRVSRAKAELGTIQAALETYKIDEGVYPLNAGGIGLPGALLQLTSPRQYMSDIPRDPFGQGQIYFYLAGGKATNLQRGRFGEYSLASLGPDERIQTTLTKTLIYDPTNGTVSAGAIVITHRTKDTSEIRRQSEI